MKSFTVTLVLVQRFVFKQNKSSILVTTVPIKQWGLLAFMYYSSSGECKVSWFRRTRDPQLNQVLQK